MIRVVIADDHNLVREGIRALLEKVDDIQVIGEAGTGQEAYELAESLKPEVVIMDIAMPRLDGTQATRRILALDTPTEVVILSMHADTVLAQRLLREGVKGYLLKDSIADELPLAIRSANQGQLYLSPAISDSVLTTLLSPQTDEPPHSPADLLTPREQEVLQLITEGYTNKAMADTLSISVKTVEKHRANLMSKLDVHDLPSLMRKVVKHGLVHID